MSTTFTDRPEHDPVVSPKTFNTEWNGSLLSGVELSSGTGGARLRVLDGVEVEEGSNYGWDWGELSDLSAKLFGVDNTSPSNRCTSQRFGVMYLPEVGSAVKKAENGLQVVRPVQIIFIDPNKHTATQISATNTRGAIACRQETGSYGVDSNGFTIGNGGNICFFAADILQTKQNTPKMPVYFGVDDVFEVLRQAAQCADRNESHQRSLARMTARLLSPKG